MSSKPKAKPYDSLAVRLTVSIAGLFCLLSFAAFLTCYLMVEALLIERIDQELAAEITEFRQQRPERGVEKIVLEMVVEAQSVGPGEICFRLLDSNGVELAATDRFPEIPLPAPDRRDAARADAHTHLQTIRVPGIADPYRLITASIGGGLVLQIGQSLRQIDHTLAQLRKLFGAALGGLALLAASTCWLMVRRAARGIAQVTATAEDIARGAFQRRVPPSMQYVEIRRLAVAFNAVLDHIEALMREMREMTDNIAHDLKSPITSIRGFAEIILTQPGKDHGELAADIVEECDRLQETIDTMLYISETESGADAKQLQIVDFTGLVREACTLFQPIAESKQIDMNFSLAERCTIRGDLRGLQRMTANLLDNALKYTPQGGIVNIELTRTPDRCLLSVRDTGIGIGAHDLPHIFKRFFRAERSRSKGSSGLGLCLAMAVAKAHGGSIAAQSALGKGSEFAVQLPANV